MIKTHRFARLLVEALRDGLGLARRAPSGPRGGYGDYELPTYLRKGIHIPGLSTSVEIDGRMHRLH